AAGLNKPRLRLRESRRILSITSSCGPASHSKELENPASGDRRWNGEANPAQLSSGSAFQRVDVSGISAECGPRILPTHGSEKVRGFQSLRTCSCCPASLRARQG